VPTVFSSAYGEMDRLRELLALMQGERAEVSPLRFQTSVHNAAAGQISIATGNRAFSTSLAAGGDSLAAALLEATAWLACHGPEIVVVVGDEAPPPQLAGDNDRFGALAAAFRLCTEATGGVLCQLIRRPH